MFVLLWPDFDGTNESYQRLAEATGLVAYDLRARVRKDHWGVVKALADGSQAEMLARSLEAQGFRPVLVDRSVAHDSARRIVAVRGIELNEQGFVLNLRDRRMTIEYSAVACLVRGEVQPGRTAQRGAGSGPSSATLRAVTAQQEPVSVREGYALPFEAFQAADVHFLTVPWIARLDMQSLGSSPGEGGPRALDALSDEMGRRARARVDRGVRTSSVATLAEQSAAGRSEAPSLRDTRREIPDERFDPYSRLIGEAERRLRDG